MCYFECSGGLMIGNNVSIAHSSSILTSTHTYSDFNLPIKYNEILKTVVIHDDVWIGCGVRILCGVHIDTRCIIGANSLVNKSVDSFSIYGEFLQKNKIFSMKKKKLFKITNSAYFQVRQLQGQLNYFSAYFDVIAVAPKGEGWEELQKQQALYSGKNVKSHKSDFRFNNSFQLVKLLSKRSRLLFTRTPPKLVFWVC